LPLKKYFNTTWCFQTPPYSMELNFTEHIILFHLHSNYVNFLGSSVKPLI
jgi:hypothetical protein